MRGHRSVNSKNTRPDSVLTNLIVFFWLGAIIGFGVIIVIAQLSGRGTIGKSSRFTEFHVCLNNNRYEPVTVVPPGTDILYLCGVIEGNGIRRGYWHLYFGDEMLRGQYFEHFPGTFFEPVRLNDGLKAGHYTIDMGSARQVIAKTEFTVVEPN